MFKFLNNVDIRIKRTETEWVLFFILVYGYWFFCAFATFHIICSSFFLLSLHKHVWIRHGRPQWGKNWHLNPWKSGLRNKICRKPEVSILIPII